MKKSLTIIFFSIQTLICFSQTDSVLQYVRSYGSGVEHFSADNLGNIYLFQREGQLRKLSPQGDSAAVFNDVRRYGKVHSLDVNNPMKVLMYYREFATVLYLDRYLNRLGALDLRKSNILQAQAVALSYDNNLWVFDELDNKLKKVDDQGKILMESVDFRQLFDDVPVPETAVDRDGFVYLYDPLRGLYVFDYYGALRSSPAIKGLKDVQVINKTLYGRKEEKLLAYTLGTLDLREAVIPESKRDLKELRVLPQGLYILINEQVDQYRYR